MAHCDMHPVCPICNSDLEATRKRREEVEAIEEARLDAKLRKLAAADKGSKKK